MRRLFVLMGAILLAMALPTIAMAANIYIDDRTDPFIVFNVADFEGGFWLNGSLLQTGYSEVVVPVPEADVHGNPITYNFEGYWLDNGETTPVSKWVYFQEEGFPLLASDILHYTYTTDGDTWGHLVGSFVSDVETDLGPIPYPLGHDQVVSGEYYDFGNAYISAVADSTPEPATFGLLALGLGIAGVFGRRRLRA